MHIPLEVRAKAAGRLPKLTTQTIFQDGFVKVVSDTPMSATDGQALGKMITDAFQYDTSVEKWSQPGPLAAPLTVQALSKPAFDRLLGGNSAGIAGVTLSATDMAVPATLVGTATADDYDTLAHEANHVQDFRQAGAHVDQIPRFLQEGKAYVVGDSYPIFLKKDGQDPALPGIASALGGYTGADAQSVMDHYVTGQDSAAAGSNGFRDEILGALFVEFLRTRVGGSGVGDAVPRLAQMTEDIGGGATFAAAFQKQFNLLPKDAQAAFVAYVHQTEGNATQRLQNTLWEPYLNANGTPHA